MATPREIVARWDAREKREQAQARARATVANDNAPLPPDGYITVDGQPLPYWLPRPAAPAETKDIA